MLELRDVNFKDCKNIFNWANDDQVRKNSFTIRKIEFKDHIKWFEKMLEDKNVYMYILEFNEIPIGQIRVNVSNNEGIISYSIDRKFRKKGFGKKIIELVEKKIVYIYAVDTIVAYVKENNYISRSIFKHMNYSEKKTKQKYTYYKIIK